MRRFLFTLPLFLVLVPVPSRATVREPAAQAGLALERDASGGRTTVIRLTARAEAEIELLGLRSGEGPIEPIPSGARHLVLSAGEERTLRIPLAPAGSAGTWSLEYRVDGLDRTTTSSVPDPGGNPTPGTLVRIGDEPPRRPSRVAAPPPAPAEWFGEAEPMGGTAQFPTLTATGVIQYRRIDGVLVGIDGATVRLWDFNDVGPNILLGTGFTDENGAFTVLFPWAVGNPIDPYPDVIIEVWAANGYVTVTSAGSDPTIWTWSSGTQFDRMGPSFSLGTWVLGNNQPAAHALTATTRGARWFDAIWGPAVEHVAVRMIAAPEGAWYDDYGGIGDDDWGIYMGNDRKWQEDVYLHEYGHHIDAEFGNLPTPDYCNFLCDDDGCGHCVWCQENASDAFHEAWPSWLATVMLDDWPGLYSMTPFSNRHEESIRSCGSYSPPLIDDPLITEGFVQALLEDITDAANETDPNGFSAGRDELTRPPLDVLTVVLDDEPSSPAGLIADFRARYPETGSALWRTCANNLYQPDGTPPDTQVPVSPSHVAGLADADATPEFYLGATDDWSGVAGFSWRLETTPGQDPGLAFLHSADDGVLELGPLTDGTYYLTVRARDEGGNWDPDYRTFGPIIIQVPEPAELEPFLGTGWSGPLVPRNTTSGSVVYPSGVIGNSTYWNYRVTNTGSLPTDGGYSVGLLLDDGARDKKFEGTLIDGGVDSGFNFGPFSIPGGRHTLVMMADFDEDLPEPDETNNRWGRQWIWNPFLFFFTLEDDDPSPAPRTAGWDDIAEGTTWYNCTGYRLVTDVDLPTEPWVVASVYAPTFGDDYDLRLHDEATSSTSGFGSNLGWSARPVNCTEAVLVNGDNRPRDFYDVGVLNPMTSKGGNFHVAVDYADPLTEGAAQAGSLAADEAARLLTFTIDAAHTGPRTVVLTLGPGAMRTLNLGWFDGNTFSTGVLAQARDAVSTDGSGVARMEFDAVAGRHALLVWRDRKDGIFAARDFTVEIRDRLPDVAPLVPAGWAAAVVPRPAQDATPTSAPFPSFLPGDQSGTYFNAAMVNPTAVGTGSTTTTQFLVDGILRRIDLAPALGAGGTDLHLGTATTTITGGRHTLGARFDGFEAVEELDEDNNHLGRQYVWEPQVMASSGFVLRPSAPPDRSGGWDLLTGTDEVFYNCDGVRTPIFGAPSPGDGYWGAVAIQPEAGDHYDLRLHEPSTGAGDGFAEHLVWSNWAPGESNFALVHFGSTPLRQFDVGVVPSTGTSRGSGYAVQAEASRDLGTRPDGWYGPWTLSSTDLLDVHRLAVPAGGALYRVRLQFEGGTAANLGISVYDGDETFRAKYDVHGDGIYGPALAHLDAAGEATELWFRRDTAGELAIAVWKRGASDRDVKVSYRLFLKSAEVTGADGGEPVSPVVGLTAPFPNPARLRSTLRFTLEEAGHVRLEVFDVAGRRLRVLVGESLPAGTHERVWEGLDDQGRRVAPGTYFVRYETSGMVERRRVLFLP